MNISNNWIKSGIIGMRSVLAGMKLTGQHAILLFRTKQKISVPNSEYFSHQSGPVTIQYPQDRLPFPDVGRYRLYMETDDCIGCDQCARICPVDCITIEKIKSPNVIGSTSDGTKKRFWLPTFDIDLAKCCFCGLCTVVCPTECLIMTPSIDYSEYDRENFLVHFGNLSPDESIQKTDDLNMYDDLKAKAKQFQETTN